MKSFVLLAALAGAMNMVEAAAQPQDRSAAYRQNPPYDLWCRDQATGPLGGTVPICMAYTYKQCMDSRTAQGESCYLNPRHDPRYRR